jgi:hypothetical protein
VIYARAATYRLSREVGAAIHQDNARAAHGIQYKPSHLFDFTSAP